MITVSLWSHHFIVLQYFIVLCLFLLCVLSCYSTTHEVFTASIQFVGSMSIFGLAKLAITIVKQPNVDALTSNDFDVFKNALRLKRLDCTLSKLM